MLAIPLAITILRVAASSSAPWLSDSLLLCASLYQRAPNPSSSDLGGRLPLDRGGCPPQGPEPDADVPKPRHRAGVAVRLQLRPSEQRLIGIMCRV